jgi:hypothetical protein
MESVAPAKLERADNLTESAEVQNEKASFAGRIFCSGRICMRG